MKRRADLLEPLGYWLPISNLCEAIRSSPSPIEPSPPPSLCGLPGRPQDGDRR